MGWFDRLLGRETRAANLSLSELDRWLDLQGDGSVSAAGIATDPPNALRSAVVYACVNVLAQTIASLPLITYRRLADGGKERAPNYPLYELLHDQPNPEMTAYEFRSCLVGHVCLWGNAYAEIERSDVRIKALWPLRPDRMTITRDGAGALLYVYRLPDGTEKPFAFENIMHWRGLSSNGVVGYSPIAQAADAIGVDLATRQYGARFFGNDSRPGGILTHPRTLTPQGAQRLRDSWEGAHRGLTNSQRVAVLEEGVTWTTIGIPPEQAQFLETRRYQRSEIAGLYRVPLHMINDLERATFSNIEHMSLEFVKFTLYPWLVQIEQAIRRDLIQISAGKRVFFAEHLVDGLLRGDITSRYQAYATGRQNGWLNANEIREFENMNAVDGGEIYFINGNMIPVERAAEKKEPAPPVNAAPPLDAADEPDADEADGADEADQADGTDGAGQTDGAAMPMGGNHE